ncbi:hypothetical protein U1Q18_020017 [Sarracenia purpurea var. burkii]
MEKWPRIVPHDGEMTEDSAPNINSVRVNSAGAVQIRQDAVGGNSEERRWRERVRESDKAIDGEQIGERSEDRSK